jgi:sigma-B regulation protein RsbU (phosphoserine phosphatase)
MRILIADDDDVSRLALQAMLTKRGHAVVAAADGVEAWQFLQDKEPPKLAILDWMMPEIDGVELCRRSRAEPDLKSLYLIMLTSRGSRQHLIEGLRAGANDYVTKPFDREELEARVNVGLQVVELQDELKSRVRELESALANVKQLQGLLPICCYCKKIRDDQNYWQQLEGYISCHSDTRFSHGICPDCMQTVVKQFAEQVSPTLPTAGPEVRPA